MTHRNPRDTENLSSQSITIRPMEISDVDFIRIGLCEIAWQDLAEDHKLLVTRSENDKMILQDFESRRNDPKRKIDYFVGELGKISVGFVGIGEFVHPEIDLHFGLIADLWTEPEYRERGIGGLLLDCATKLLKMKGYKRTYLQVSASNPKAAALYKKKGFYEDHITMIKNNDIC